MPTAVKHGPAYEFKYDFRNGTHVPQGVTAEGVMEERSRIEDRYGEATIDNSVAAVLAEPEVFPNLAAFGPADADDAIRRATAEGIRIAYRSVVRVKITPSGAEVTRPVRVIHAVPSQDPENAGKLAFKEIDTIKKDPIDTKNLVKQLKMDAHAFAAKLEDVLAEIESAL
jgi:hypothetical protein